MEMRGGGCCIAMYGAGAGESDVAWKMGRIMLRFRPIAPKPAAPSTVDPPALGSSSRRSKRKVGGAAGGSRKKKAQKIGVESKSSSPATSSTSTTTSTCSSVITLPLMPEKPERREERTADPVLVAPYDSSAWFPLQRDPANLRAEVVVPRPVRLAGSWVTVESISDTWMNVDGAGGAAAVSDAAVVRALATDCSFGPGFITDALHQVVWTNEAYRRMVAGPPLPPESPEEWDEEAGVKVWLATRGMVPAASACRAFTCHVQVKNSSRRKGKASLAAPCDVWRLDDGRWAWRLDIEAALSLSKL